MRARPAIDVTLLVPGLLGPRSRRGDSGPGSAGPGDPDAVDALLAGLDLHALDHLLARAGHTVEPAADGSIEALAFRVFGHEARPAAGGGPDVPYAGTASHPATAGGPAAGDAPCIPSADWPVAAITALVDCEASIGRAGPWLRVDPVHLRPDVADLVLFDAVDAGVSSEEARALAEIVNGALRPGGPVIDAAHPHRWYVALEAPARMATTPLSLAAGAGISTAMPRGPDAPRWRRWMNEVQMALHDCPVNAERERRGAAPINSVWPWGVGSLPPVSGAPAPFVRAWSDDALVRGLARHAGVECGALPGDGAWPGDGASPGHAGTWLGSAPRPGAHLIAFDALYRAVRRSDLDGWRAGLARFSASWAEPLLDALDRGAVARISIRDERGHRFTATRWGRFRWWRRRGGLAARIADAARRAR